MQVIICQNDISVVIKQLQELLRKECIIKSMYIVDQSDDQVVVIVDDKEITQTRAEDFWSGYKAALL
jgi:hypothetical protein